MAAAPKSPDGRRARWQEHNQARRQVILDAALVALSRVEPGTEIHVQQIADEAGLSRTVVYRHFADRADLDLAVQSHIFESIGAELGPTLSLQGSPVEIIRGIISSYVGWVAQNPSLQRFAERDPDGIVGPSPMDQAIEYLAQSIQSLIGLVVDQLEIGLTEDERDALDPLTFGLVGSAFAAVRRWMAKPGTPPAETMVEVLTESIWLQIAGLAGARGVVLEPDVPIEQLLAEVMADRPADDEAHDEKGTG